MTPTHNSTFQKHYAQRNGWTDWTKLVKLTELKWLRPDRQSWENAPWKQFFRRLDVYFVAREKNGHDDLQTIEKEENSPYLFSPKEWKSHFALRHTGRHEKGISSSDAKGNQRISPKMRQFP